MQKLAVMPDIQDVEQLARLAWDTAAAMPVGGRLELDNSKDFNLTDKAFFVLFIDAAIMGGDLYTCYGFATDALAAVDVELEPFFMLGADSQEVFKIVHAVISAALRLQGVL